ncbi:MAG: recombinase family protein [Candidatus Rokuibacteriota bacterium]
MRGPLEASQLTRRAFVYVRQSSMAQVVYHHESTMMQYDLRQRALTLGWASEAIEVIDEDQARSGTKREGRSGFARLADAVAHGEAGGVFALDVSRLARRRRTGGACWRSAAWPAWRWSTSSASTTRTIRTTSSSWS